MSQTVVAKRYAEALFQLAIEKNNAGKIVDELNVVKELFEKDENVIHIFTHPRISNAEKISFIETAFAGLEKDVINTLKILIQRDRIDMTESIIEYFIDLYNEANGIAVATVYSVRALTEAEKTSIEQSFKAQLNKETITIVNVIEPSLIGGLRIRVGNTIYDGSISNKLNRFEASLVSASK